MTPYKTHASCREHEGLGGRSILGTRWYFLGLRALAGGRALTILRKQPTPPSGPQKGVRAPSLLLLRSPALLPRLLVSGAPAGIRGLTQPTISDLSLSGCPWPPCPRGFSAAHPATSRGNLAIEDAWLACDPHDLPPAPFLPNSGLGPPSLAFHSLRTACCSQAAGWRGSPNPG